MLLIRRSATIAVLTVLACTVTLLGASTGPRGAAEAAGTSAVSPAAVKPSAAVEAPCGETRLRGAWSASRA